MPLRHKEGADDNHRDTSLIELIQELSPASREEVRDFVEFLVAKRRKLVQQAEANGWPAGFFESTAGSISDPTFVRPPQRSRARDSR